MELTNGCVCCTVRDDLLKSVAALLERPQPPEHILVETTGLADPVPVAEQLLDPRVQGDIRLDSIITLVDAENFDRNLEHAEQAYSQITTGDLLLVNKIDLVGPEIVEKIEAGLRTLNPRARTLRCVQAQVDLDLVLGLGLLQPSEGRAGTDSALVQGADEGRDHRRYDGHDREPDHGHDGQPDHGHAFGSVSLRAPSTISVEAFARLLEDLPPGVIRGKGILAVRDVPTRLIFHLVGDRWSVTAGEPWSGDQARATEVVFIGKALEEATRARLEQRLRACLE
jgi:G3E family GTPase